MDFKKILEYQEKDNELSQLNSMFFQSDSVVNGKKYKAVFDDSSKKLDDLNQEANTILAKYNDIKARIDEISQELEDFEGVVDETKSIKDADYYIKKVYELEDKLNAIEKEISYDANNIDKVNLDFNKYDDLKKKASDGMDQSNVEANKLMAQVKAKGQPIQAAMKELEQEIDPDILQKYKQLKKSGVVKKYPYIVSVEKGTEYCTKCGVELSVESRNLLKVPGKVTECSNCRRILFVEE